VVLAGREMTPDLAAHNYLRMCIAGGLDQDRIHVNRSGNPRRFRLYRLSPADLQSLRVAAELSDMFCTLNGATIYTDH
jgi:hypothetical protein